MPQIKLRFYGLGRKAGGLHSETRFVPEGTTIREVWDSLQSFAHDHEFLAQVNERQVSVLLNGKLVRRAEGLQTTLVEGDTVTFMQLITGGIGASNCDLGTCDRRTRTVGVVGESRCGKTTLARCILRLIQPTTGEEYFDGTDVLTLSPGKVGELRRDMQIIFQNPHSSLDPRMSVFRIVGEPLRTHTSMSHG